MTLVREHINEKFKESSDPVKDMNIGYKDFKDYLSKQFNNKVFEYNFWRWWRTQMKLENSYEDLLDLMLEILEETPVEVQLEWAKDALENYYVYKEKMRK